MALISDSRTEATAQRVRSVSTQKQRRVTRLEIEVGTKKALKDFIDAMCRAVSAPARRKSAWKVKL